ncbi:MAG TPA: alpha-amylase family glycosyl hydrolase [Chloroflexota bacterium]|nr:alpha-amylase family glycosyl hydrolase [Chloroflexota bacterium]
MRPRNWWDTAVIYEIYLRSFQDSNGDGVGDLPGLISRLDYLNGQDDSLGVDAVWLTPLYPSPMFDFGYDIADYESIDPVFGTLQDFDELVAGAHARGIKVVMDFVANHTSHLHAWFQESRAGRHSPRRDWYVWRDPAPGGGPPNNWLSVFGGPAWTFDEATGQYYLHSFLPQQPDLNWRNPEVREAMFDVIRFWTRRGVDGFRLDAIDHIAKDERLRDNPAAEGELPPESTGYELLEHLYDRRHPIIHEWLQELRAVAEEDGTPRMMVSEIYGLEPEAVALFHGIDRPEMSMSFNFDVLQAPWDAGAFRAAIETFAANLPPRIWPNVVLNNHDQSRLVSRYDWDGLGEARARLAAMLLLTVRGAAFLYYGEELGMRNGIIPRERLQDPVGIRHWPLNSGRDPERTPMQWTAGPTAGFTSGCPWLPVNPDHDRINVATESNDPGSLLALYRDLLRRRRETPALLTGTYEAIDAGSEDVYAHLRQDGTQRLLIALNFAPEERHASFDLDGERAAIFLSTRRARAGSVNPRHLALAPLEGTILSLE